MNESNILYFSIIFQIEFEQKKEHTPVKDEETAEMKKVEIIEQPDDPRYDIMTTLEGACFQSR